MSSQSHDPGARDRRTRQRLGAILLLVASLASLAGMTHVASALWSTTSGGSANARAVTAQALTATAIPSPSAELYPGATGGLQFSVTNPNPYAVTLTSIGLGAVSSSDPTNCPASNLTVGAGGTLATPIDVDANSTSSTVTVPDAVTMVLAAPNGCQDVTFTVSITLSGTQA